MESSIVPADVGKELVALDGMLQGKVLLARPIVCMCACVCVCECVLKKSARGGMRIRMWMWVGGGVRRDKEISAAEENRQGLLHMTKPNKGNRVAVSLPASHPSALVSSPFR